jgi:nitrogen fixation/metabolism regulation signal transduction histidine kinase
MLQVSQEVLEHLPTAVIGIDDDGLIVMANRQADALFDDDAGPLLGCEAGMRLPVTVVECVGTDETSTSTIALADGSRLHVLCHRMGEMCKSKGTVLVLSPVDGG